MPIISINSSRPLPDAAAPVLDNQRRPTVDYSGQIAGVGKLGSIKAPELPADELAKPDAALASIGQGIAQAGGVMEALAIKRQEAQTDYQVGDAGNQMKLAAADFEAWKTQNPDPASWQKEQQQRHAALASTLLTDDKLTPQAKEQIQLHLQKFGGDWASSTMVDASKETFARARDSYGARIDESIDNQNEPQFLSLVDAAVKKNYISEGTAENARQKFKLVGERKKKEAEADAFDSAANALTTVTAGKGEQAGLEMLDSGAIGDFAAVDKERLRGVVRQVATGRSAEEMNSLANGIASGAISSSARIDEMAHDNPALPPRVVDEAKRYLISRDATQQKIDREENGVKNAVEYRQRVLSYDPKQDPDRTQYFQLVQEIGDRVDQSMAGELTGELYKKYGLNPPQVKVRPEVQQNVSKSLDIIFDPERGVIPWKKAVPVTDAKGQPVKDDHGNIKTREIPDEAARQRALDAQTRIEIRMADWYKNNPEKAQDLNAVKEHLREVLPEGTRAGALDLLQKKLPQKAVSDSLRSAGDPGDLEQKLPSGLKPHAQDFIDAGRQYGLNPKVLAAISALETGGGTSKAFREKRNAMGISDEHGPVEMPSVRDSIFKQAATLARSNGPYSKARTLDDIGAIYAPPGAVNDLRGTNAGWAEGVRAYLSRL